ncbi:MAG: thioredoxin domain-containing protein [Chitinophagaceae bacterium]|nr:thioredoxin domain-containing protein [Chitinophagaceae bacterium]
MSHTNRLIHETSPYLLQHAHNPVDWYPWGEEALQKAKTEQKPILVSIGYSACHWCHVMERESFENEETAAIMNTHFINIKIDREERPDLDHIYMDAVQAMTGSGGWPLNVFLTPEGKPFYGGTYFPPKPVQNRPAWQDVLTGVVQAFSERRHEIDAQAENLTAHLLQSNSFGIQSPEADSIYRKDNAHAMAVNILRQADKTWGGFGRAPKFPQTGVIQYLLRYHHETRNEEALTQALLSLDRMALGGLYDQIGGGFTRYSTDTEWLVPHFEKMLYDNALLLGVYAEAYALTKKEKYREVIAETVRFVERELTSPEGGFYSALDADSEGVEGKYYTFSRKEVIDLLPEKEGEIFCQWFDITEEGNWEGRNIPWVARDRVSKMGEIPDLGRIITEGKENLLTYRAKRVRPQLDDKQILSWNALMVTGLCKAYAATGEKDYLHLARTNMDFLLRVFVQPNGEWLHTYKSGKARFPAFLDDLAFLIEALIQLQEVTGETSCLERARELTQQVIDQFSEPDTGYFYYTPAGQTDVIIRKKEVYDGALPSGNSVMAQNLIKLALYFDQPGWGERGQRITTSLGQAIIKYPTSFARWACILLEQVAGTREIAVVGEKADDLFRSIISEYIPHNIIMYSKGPNNHFPLLNDKKGEENGLVYVCHNYSCLRPVSNLMEFRTVTRVNEW